jgi:hypothetical protein
MISFTVIPTQQPKLTLNSFRNIGIKFLQNKKYPSGTSMIWLWQFTTPNSAGIPGFGIPSGRRADRVISKLKLRIMDEFIGTNSNTNTNTSAAVRMNVDTPMDVAVDVVVHMCRSEFPVSLEVGRSTVADLKSYLHRYLRDWEHDSRSSFGRDLARDFAVVDKLAVLLMDDVDLCGHEGVTVFELFVKTPCELFRTVTAYQVTPAIQSVHSSPWSAVAPLYCGAFDLVDEFPASCFSVSGDVGVAAVRGISLRSRIPEKQGEEEFTRPITNDELKEEQYYPMTVVEAALEGSPYGRLFNTTLFTRTGTRTLMVPRLKQVARPSNMTLPANVRKDDVVKRRQIFYAFVLPADTNLAELGMAVIFDDQDRTNPGHFTLVTWPPSLARQFVSDAYETDGSFIYYRGPEPAIVHPEYFLTRLDNVEYAVFPQVAARFCCHSLWIKASAEPSEEDLDVNRRDFETAKVIARATAKLSEIAMDLSDPGRILGAIDELISAHYCLDRLDPQTQVILRAALLAACSKCEDDEDGSDLGDMFRAAIEMLFRHVS